MCDKVDKMLHSGMRLKGSENLKHYLVKHAVAFILSKEGWSVELEKEIDDYIVDVYAKHRQRARHTGEPSEYVHPPDEIKLIEVSHHSLEKDKKKLKELVEDLSQVSDHLIEVSELSDNIKEIEEEIRRELLV